MKILFVQKMNGVSGSELYLMQIMPELKRRGYLVEMLLVFPTNVASINQRFVAHLNAESITTHEIYGHSDMSPVLFYKINQLLKKGKYDIVQSNLIHADLWMSVIKRSFNPNLKIISVKHGYSPTYSAKYGYNFKYLKREAYYWVQKFVCDQCNYNVAISNGLYNVYVKGGITSPDKIKMIHYGLTLTTPPPALEVDVPNEKYILITGRLIGFKGHKYLINAWKNVNGIFPTLKLYIAGEGKLRSELEDHVANAGLQNVIVFLGHVSNPHPLMKNSLFTVVSSIWEGFGLILLESWLHKKPVVAFDVPAMNEVIDHGENGLLANNENSEDLADKIIYLLNNELLISKYGENGYQKLNSYFTLKRMTDEMEEVYKAVNNNYSSLLIQGH